MRESFVFHAEYIDDLPDDYKDVFAMSAINYALYGKEPDFDKDTLTYSLWLKVVRRIDAEGEKYQKTCERRRAAAQKRYEQTGGKPKPQEERSDTKAAKFEKPTVEQVSEYCAERNNGLDARTFFDFYESKGWKVGASRMRDWRACVRTWEQRRKTEQTGGRQKVGAVWGTENEISDEMADIF
ncbi:MAG: DUF6291 domain-containing protein [Lachnospiraceae bacterium]|nr:DUF6291 domain-containing protein [Lachnospiraceae bacterium]